MWTDMRIRITYGGVSGGSAVRILFCGRDSMLPLTWGD